MAFTGQENHTITLAAGAALTAAYRTAHPTWPKGYFFSKSTLNSILAQTGCVGIRFYFGQDTAGTLKLVFAGALANEDDILTIVGDAGALCPPLCGVSNALNSITR